MKEAGGASSQNFEETLTVLDLSQYSFAEIGSSACTPIACSAAVALLHRLENDIDIDDASFLNEAIIIGVASYSNIQHLRVGDHMSVEEYSALSQDMQQKVVKVGESFQGLLTELSPFRNLIRRAQEQAATFSSSTTNYVGIIITKPPETVCITVPSLSNDKGSAKIYSFFDSHSRPEYGLTGSYLVTSSSIESVLHRLSSIFPQVDLEGCFNDTYMQMLYTTYEATVFQIAAEALNLASLP